jgi:hypothetical protein
VLLVVAAVVVVVLVVVERKLFPLFWVRPWPWSLVQ